MSEAAKVTALVPVGAAHSMALEPSSMREAFEIAKMAVQSGMLPSKVQRPEQAMMILMRGRELGLTAMQSFASLHVIEGKCVMSSELVVAMVKKRREVCRYFRFVSGDETQATFETHREGNPEPTRLTFTMAQAQSLGLSGKDNWRKQPANMLRWRAATALARLEYPELTLGIYSPDEAEDIGSNAPPPAPPITTAAVVERDEEPLEDVMGRWRETLKNCATTAEADKVRREVKARLQNGSPQFAVMVDLYKAAITRLRGKAPKTPVPKTEIATEPVAEERDPGEEG